MAALRKLAGQTALYGVSSIVGRLLNYLLVPLHTRVFSTQEFGAITELYAYVAFLLVLLTYGMETAFFRFGGAAVSETERKQIFSTSFISILCSTLLFWLLVFTQVQSIAEALNYAQNPDYIVYFAAIVGLDVLSTVPFARLRLLNKAFTFVMVNLGSIGLYIALNIFFLMYCPVAFEDESLPGHGWISSFYRSEFGIGYVFVANLISSGFKFALLTPWMKEIFFGFHRKLAARLYAYAWPLLLLSLAGIINEIFSRAYFVQLSPLAEEEARAELGIFGACYKVAMLLTIGIQAYRFAAEPYVFSLKSDESAKTQASVMKYFSIAASLLMLALLCFLDIAMLLVGEAMREGASVVPILLLAYFCFGVVFNLSFWYKLNDKTIYGALIAIVGAALTIGLNVWLIPLYSYVGSAWATLLAYASMMLLSYYLGQKHHPISYPLREISLYVGLAAALYGLHYFLSLPEPFHYASGAVVVVSYVSIVMLRESKKIKPSS